MNVSELLQDSPSQHRRRPPAVQHDTTPPSQSTPPSLPSASASPQSQHQLQHQHPHQHSLQPPPAPPSQYPPQPSSYYSHQFPRSDPPQTHRITPRPASQISPPVDATPAMASLQHPSPLAPPPHVHPNASWGPPRQGSSPLTVSNLGPPASLHTRTPHHHQQPPQIKPAMPGPDRSPVAQRAHASGSSTPSNIAAHSPTAKPMLTTSDGVLILDRRTAEEQKARPPMQPHGPSSTHTSTSPGGFRSGREREKEWERERERERRQEDMDFIRHAARERVVSVSFDRDQNRERALPSPRDRPMASPHDRSISSTHDRALPSSLDRSMPSPHERERAPQHMHRMSPLGRPPPPQPPPPLRTPHQSPPGSGHRIPGSAPHDRMPPPNERDRVLPHLHERQLHDRERIHPPPPLSHPHRQGQPLLPGQGQFQTHPPEWDQRDVPREREMPIGPPRDLVREKDLDPMRDPDYAFHPDHPYIRERRMREAPRDQAMPFPQRERDPVRGDIAMQREREREIHSTRERERIERERDTMSREIEGVPMLPREREIRERETHIQRDRPVTVHREGETGPGILPRGHDRERDRERERRTHARMPSPHGINLGGAGTLSLSGTGTTGPGAPGPHHQPPPPLHDHPRERELQLMNERERQLAWERERGERGMERRHYHERMPDRERIAMPIPERENERISLIERDRAVTERDRVMFERERMAFSDRDRPYLERDRLERDRVVERDRAFHERGRVTDDRDRAVHERERALPPERIILERERIHMRPHSYDIVERESFGLEKEREHSEAMGRNRERGVEASSTSGPGPSRDREADRDRKVADVTMAEREDDEHPAALAPDRELVEKRERERAEVLERERGPVIDREREPMNPTNPEGDPAEVERERLEAREHFELLQREIGELFERDRLGLLDNLERERLQRLERERFELLERERMEMLERERLEMLERMPSAEELAKARKEREKKPFVSLGTYVWPRAPFPYYFPEWIPSPVVEEKSIEVKTTTAEASSSSDLLASAPQSTPATTQMPTELRLTILVPPSFLPPARPQKFRLWGGGLPPPPPFPYTPSIYCFSRRRVYTDDSDVIQCAVHAGLLTWSGIARAKKEGRTIRVVLALVPTLASASGAVKNGQCENHVGTNGINTNGHVNGTASVPRTRTSTPLPPPASAAPSTSSLNNETQVPGYAGGVWASRFIGGWGESFYGEESAGRGDSAGRMTSFEEAEDDGRGCVSCGWGWGHDGSAFEVVSVDVVEQNAHVAPGLGRRNRAQRLAEYAQRRADVLGLPLPPSPPLFDVTNTPKRRRLNVDFTETKKAGSSELVVIAEEAKKMQAMTISFGVPDREKSKAGVGFKYDAQVVQSVLFPHLNQLSVVVASPPANRPKTAAPQESRGEGDVEMDSIEDPRLGIVLEGSKETFLITWHEDKSKYTLSELGPYERTASRKPSPPPPISLTEAAPKTHDTRGPSEERRMPEDDSLSSSGPTGPLESNVSGEPKSRNAETEPPLKPPIPSRSASLAPVSRVLRSNLAVGDFSFEDDVIVIKGSEQSMDDGKMDVDGEGRDAIKMRVLRWRWQLKP